jgi:hypothetical protein
MDNKNKCNKSRTEILRRNKETCHAVALPSLFTTFNINHDKNYARILSNLQVDHPSTFFQKKNLKRLAMSTRLFALLSQDKKKGKEIGQVVKHHASPLKILFLSCALLFALSVRRCDWECARTIFSQVLHTRATPPPRIPNSTASYHRSKLAASKNSSPLPASTGLARAEIHPCRLLLPVSPSSVGFALVFLAGGQSNPNPPPNSEHLGLYLDLRVVWEQFRGLLCGIAAGDPWIYQSDGAPSTCFFFQFVVP